MSDRSRSYGVDTTPDFSTLVEATLQVDGTMSLVVVVVEHTTDEDPVPCIVCDASQIRIVTWDGRFVRAIVTHEPSCPLSSA